MPDKIDIYAYLPVPGCPANWTIQRAGRVNGGLYYWRLFDDGEMVAITKRRTFYDEARKWAEAYIREAGDDE